MGLRAHRLDRAPAVLATGVLAFMPAPASWPLPDRARRPHRRRLHQSRRAGHRRQSAAGHRDGSSPSSSRARRWRCSGSRSASAPCTMPDACRAAAARPRRASPRTPRRRGRSSPSATAFWTWSIGGLVHLGFPPQPPSAAPSRRLARMPPPGARPKPPPGATAPSSRSLTGRAPVVPPVLPDEPPRARAHRRAPHLRRRAEPEAIDDEDFYPPEEDEDDAPVAPVRAVAASSRRARAPRPAPGSRAAREAQPSLLDEADGFELPALSLLAEAQAQGPRAPSIAPERLEAMARRLEGVLEDFGVKGDIINVRPGPVVTLYELEPAPGIKSSRVISLADDIARSMSAISARVAVVPGRNAIGIELPNENRETVYLREMLASAGFREDEGQAPHLPRQDHRRRADHRRPRPHAASADRRHHRLGQVGRHQHLHPLAALPDDAGAVPPDHDRPQDAGALDLRRHPASADAGRHRSLQGRGRAQMGGPRDGGPLSQDEQDRRAQHRRLQPARQRSRRRRARSSPAPCRPASTARPARRSSRARSSTSSRCPSSSSSSTKWPT